MVSVAFSVQGEEGLNLVIGVERGLGRLSLRRQEHLLLPLRGQDSIHLRRGNRWHAAVLNLSLDGKGSILSVSFFSTPELLLGNLESGSEHLRFRLESLDLVLGLGDLRGLAVDSICRVVFLSNLVEFANGLNGLLAATQEYAPHEYPKNRAQDDLLVRVVVTMVSWPMSLLQLSGLFLVCEGRVIQEDRLVKVVLRGGGSWLNEIIKHHNGLLWRNWGFSVPGLDTLVS